jgi:hypothetical protein
MIELIKELMYMLEDVSGKYTYYIEDAGKEILEHVCEESDVEYVESNNDDTMGIYIINCNRRWSGTMYTSLSYSYSIDRVRCSNEEDPICKLLSMLVGVKTDYNGYDYALEDVKELVVRFLKPVCKAKVRESIDSIIPIEVSLNVRCKGENYTVYLYSESVDKVYDVEMVRDDEEKTES